MKFRKIIAAVTAAGIMAGAGITAAAAEADVDGNGKVNVKDVTMLLKKIAARNTSSANDINGDGKVNVKDATELLRLIVSSGTSTSKPQAEPTCAADLLGMTVGEIEQKYNCTASVFIPQKEIYPPSISFAFDRFVASCGFSSDEPIDSYRNSDKPFPHEKIANKVVTHLDVSGYMLDDISTKMPPEELISRFKPYITISEKEDDGRYYYFQFDTGKYNGYIYPYGGGIVQYSIGLS